MREILFRGKTKLSGNWCEGFLVKTGDHFRISTQNDFISFGVDPETIGQYTGLTDKNGKRIFEGEIIQGHTGLVMEVKFGQHEDDEFEAEANGWFVINSECSYSFGEDWSDHNVIGNIHDNPELLKGEQP